MGGGVRRSATSKLVKWENVCHARCSGYKKPCSSPNRAASGGMRQAVAVALRRENRACRSVEMSMGNRSQHRKYRQGGSSLRLLFPA